MATSNDNGYTGYRYLVDATGSRQYAVKYENGRLSRNIEVFDESGKSSFKPGETVYAFDDEIKTGSGSGGLLKVSPTAVQITINAEGKPVSLKQLGVDYDMSFDTTPGAAPVASYNMTAASRQLLKENGFSASFPKEISGSLGTNDFDSQVTSGGLILPGQKTLGAATPFPPQHDSGAVYARLNAAAPAPEKEVPAQLPEKSEPDAARYTKADAQTLVEKKNLGDGDTLKLVFNFASRRVSEAVLSSKGSAISNTKFEDYDESALEAAFNRLTKMGGTPRPLVKPQPLSYP